MRRNQPFVDQQASWRDCQRRTLGPTSTTPETCR